MYFHVVVKSALCSKTLRTLLAMEVLDAQVNQLVCGQCTFAREPFCAERTNVPHFVSSRVIVHSTPLGGGEIAPFEFAFVNHCRMGSFDVSSE